MRHSLYFPAALFSLALLADSTTAQQTTPPEIPPESPQGIYDPDSPQADDDGFIWAGSQTPTPDSQAPSSDQDAGPQPVPGHASELPALGRTSIANDARTAARPEKNVAAAEVPGEQATYLSGYYSNGSEPEPPTPAKQGSMFSLFSQMFGGLGIVVGLFILGTVVLKRVSAKGNLLGGRGRTWQVIEAVPLGTKRALYVTRFVDRIYLLGATEQQITLLGEHQDPGLVAALESGDTDFRRFLVPESLASWQKPSPKEGKAEKRFENAPSGEADLEIDEIVPDKRPVAEVPVPRLPRSVTV